MGLLYNEYSRSPTIYEGGIRDNSWILLDDLGDTEGYLQRNVGRTVAQQGLNKYMFRIGKEFQDSVLEYSKSIEEKTRTRWARNEMAITHYCTARNTTFSI